MKKQHKINQKSPASDAKTSINMWEERILKLNVKKIGELVDEELQFEYDAKKENLR